MTIGPRLRKVLLVTVSLLAVVAGLPVLLGGMWVAAWVWVVLFPPTPEYTLTVHNRGQLEVVRGYFTGDSLWRPVGGIRPGRATAFLLRGSSGREDLDYRLHLVRSDSSRVTVEIGWVTGDWSLSSMDHDAAVIETDTSRIVGRVIPMDRQNVLMSELRGKRLIDSDRP